MIKSITVDSSGAVTLVTSRETVNFNGAAGVTVSAAEEIDPYAMVPWVSAAITLSNGRIEMVDVACPIYRQSVYDLGAAAGAQTGYDTGWNAALSEAGAPGGGVVYSGGTYYENLYTVNQYGAPTRVGSGIIAPTAHILTPR